LIPNNGIFRIDYLKGVGTIGYGFMGRVYTRCFNRMAEGLYPMSMNTQLVTMAAGTESKVLEAAKLSNRRSQWVDIGTL